MTWRLEAAAHAAVRGRFWRVLAPRWAFDPLPGAGAARAGGRWNVPGQPALYRSESHATAIAEYQQDLPRPGTLTAHDVNAQAILDLTNPTVRHAIGLDDAFLRLSWKYIRDVERRRPPCRDFVAAVASRGWHGWRVPSVQASGTNLVLWRWNEAGAPGVRHIDPLGDLPPHQSSWQTRPRYPSPANGSNTANADLPATRRPPGATIAACPGRGRMPEGPAGLATRTRFGSDLVLRPRWITRMPRGSQASEDPENRCR